MADLQTVLARNPDCPVREVQDGYIVLSAAGDGAHPFDGVEAFIWARLDGNRDLAAILADVAAEFDVEPAQAQADLLDFADALLAAGLVAEA